MRFRLRTLPLCIAFFFLLCAAFDLYRFSQSDEAKHTSFFAGMAAVFSCAAGVFIAMGIRREEPSKPAGAFRFQLRTLLIWLAVLPALIGLGYVYRDWLADLILDEWLMRGLP